MRRAKREAEGGESGASAALKKLLKQHMHISPSKACPAKPPPFKKADARYYVPFVKRVFSHFRKVTKNHVATRASSE